MSYPWRNEWFLPKEKIINNLSAQTHNTHAMQRHAGVTHTIHRMHKHKYCPLPVLGTEGTGPGNPQTKPPLVTGWGFEDQQLRGSCFKATEFRSDHTDLPRCCLQTCEWRWRWWCIDTICHQVTQKKELIMYVISILQTRYNKATPLQIGAISLAAASTRAAHAVSSQPAQGTSNPALSLTATR